MSNFTSSETGDFDKYFMTTTELIDRFAQGGLWLWGSNTGGVLGDNTRTNRSSPVQTVAGGTNWKQVSTGTAGATGSPSSAAIKTDGTLWTWGGNNYGQLGQSTLTDRSSPIQTIAGGTNWKQVSFGGAAFAAIKTDGTLWTCGYNATGQLGDNTRTNRSSPIQTITGGTDWKQVSAGHLYITAIKTDGTLWTLGSNSYGQLGDNTRTSRSSPVQTITGGTNWKQVSAGYYHIAAIKTDGTLWTWGYDGYGQLGDNTTTNKSSPIQTIASGTNWKQVSATKISHHMAAIKTDGTLWTWGYNGYGQLGDNTMTDRSSPVQTICGGNGWKQISTGGLLTVAIKTDGTLWTWGFNNVGQLGDNTRTSRSSPVQTIAGGTNWKQVEATSSVLATQYSDIGQVL